MIKKSSKTHFHVSVRDHALNQTVLKAMKAAPEFLEGAVGVVVLIAHEGTPIGQYHTGCMSVLFGGDDGFENAEHGIIVIYDDTREMVGEKYVTECRWKKRVLVISQSRELIPREIELAADYILQIPPIKIPEFRAACKAMLDIEPTLKEAKEALSYQREALWTALRPGRPMADVLRRLRSMPDPVIKPNADAKQIRLDELHGYGPAKDWGLQLAADLVAWRNGDIGWDDVDKGLLLCGQPGTGKTIYAAALAATCGVALVATSLGQWQAAGHLGDMLKAMRRDFAKAQANAPSIIFIDELDSVGSRQTFDSDHRSYSTQVVNALLECLDGAGGREGVVVIGATNHPDMIDPAILRPGRLDKCVEIPLPNAPSRAAIIKHYLDDLSSDEDLAEVVPRTIGFSGADLAQLCRQARRAARLEKRSVTACDLLANLPEMVPVVGDYRRSIAIHEAGHTVVGVRLNYGQFMGVAIADHLRLGSIQPAGGAAFDMSKLTFRNRQTYLDQVCTLLAGIAAEELVLGSFREGGGIGEDCDLARATTVATQIEAQFGMGKSVRYTVARDAYDLELARRSDPELRKRIEGILDEQFRRAKEILTNERPLLDALSAVLIEKSGASPEEFFGLETIEKHGLGKQTAG